MSDIIRKLEQSGLVGRSGSSFPTHLKWKFFKEARADKKYIICNGAEGEMDAFKDEYIIQHYTDDIIGGIKIALDFFENSSAYTYLKPEYFKKYGGKIQKAVKGLPIKVVQKRGGYVGGEESVACEVIEGRFPRPRKKPPFLTEKGLYGFPTLVNNVETFYWISKIAKGEYENNRFYCITGDVKNKGVFELGEKLSIEDVLRKTKNYPNFDFCVQAGGGVSGEVLLKNELKSPLRGVGFIRVIDKKKDPFVLMEKWIEFFSTGNCDKCVPCREGTYRLYEMIKSRNIDEEVFDRILTVLEKTSFCYLGKSVPIPLRSMYYKVIKNADKN